MAGTSPCPLNVSRRCLSVLESQSRVLSRGYHRTLQSPWLEGRQRQFCDWSTRRADAETVAVVRNQVEKASAHEAGRGKLKGAVNKKADRVSEPDNARNQLLESFAKEVPDLFETGSAIETALHLPLNAGPSSELALKRLVLTLSRRLEDKSDVSWSSKDLALLPLLLQRIGLQDHKLFSGYCEAVRKSLPNFQASDLKTLFRGVEDYRLLHPLEGPALAKLVGTLAKDSTPLSAATLQNLTSAAFSTKSRGLLQPMLKRLVEATEEASNSSPTPPDAIRYAVVASELYAGACGLSTNSLKKHLENATAALSGLPDEDELRPLALSCAAKVYLSAPQETKALVEAAVAKLPSGGLTAPLETSASRHLLIASASLPAKYRAVVADKILGSPSVEEIQKLHPQAATLYLRLLSDLPKPAPTEVLEALARRVLSAAQDAPHPPGVIASAFVGAQSVGTEGGDDIAKEALAMLDSYWGKLTTYDLQALFRSTGDVDQLVKRTLDNMSKMKDLRVQFAAFRHAAVAGGALPVEKLKKQLQTSIARCSKEQELSGAEAILRTFPAALSDEATGLQKDLATSLRARLFDAKLESPLRGNQRPPRGFFKYLETCTERDRYWREARKESAEVSPGDKPADKPVGQGRVTHKEEYTCDVPGVEWHRGMEGWVVSVEEGGVHKRSDYFLARPRLHDDMDEAERQEVMAAIEQSRNAAVRYRQGRLNGPE